jgi:RNA polymerase sigma factor (sigma-70 family)
VISFRSNREAAGTSDRDLIRACRRGRVGAWRRLLEKYERIVFSVPRRYGLSTDDAADITQLTFTILVQSLDELPEDSKLGGWLTTVARRHTWRLLERNRRQRVTKHAALEESATLQSKDPETVERWELAEWLDHGLSRISRQCRDLLSALYLDPDQPSYAKVAARLGMAVGSVGPTRIRCLERLRRALDE